MGKVNRGVPDSKPETWGLKSHSKGALRRGPLGPSGVVLANLCCPRVARLGIAGSGGFGRGRELVPPTSLTPKLHPDQHGEDGGSSRWSVSLSG